MTDTAKLVSPRAGHTAAMRAMHWVGASLVIGSYVTAPTMSFATSSPGATRLVVLHHLGLAILTVTAFRFVLRQRTEMPRLPTDTPRPQRIAPIMNVIGHYGVLLLQPLLGLTASILHGDRVLLPGKSVLPNLLPVDWPLSHVLFGAHGSIALLLLRLIGMHLAAALYHHFIGGDDVLAGMLPGLERRGATALPVPLARG